MCLWYFSSSKGYRLDRAWCLHGRKAGGGGEGKEQETFADAFVHLLKEETGFVQ